MPPVAGNVNRRAYRSERRREQAEETREKVLAAAAELFQERGYEGASIAAIAAAAGVSQETIYARFRNKRALVGELLARAVRGTDPRPVPEQEGPRAIMAGADQREQLRLFAADLALRLERAAPLLAIVAGAARGEPELTELVARAHAGRLESFREFVDAVARNGPLRVSKKDATAQIYRRGEAKREGERMRFHNATVALGVLAGCLLLLAAGAAVAASPPPPPSKVFVSDAAMPSAAGKSCATASFGSVQAAIAAVAKGGQVYLCGTSPFVESVAIESKAVTLTGDPGAAIQAPANAAAPTTFFSSRGLETPNAVVTVTGDSNVSITGLIVEGPFANSGCGDDDFGVLAVGGRVTLLNDRVLAVAAADQAGAGGCQLGVGIQIGRQHWPGESSPVDFSATAKVQGTTVSGYQKNGITADGAGTKIDVYKSTVDGGGQTPAIARNGIQISRGATGQVRGSTIQNNEYIGSGGFASATGVLVYGGCGDPLATGVDIHDNTIANNDSGVVLANYTPDPACAASAIAPTSNHVHDNTISKSDGDSNASPFTDMAGNDYTGYQVGIGVTGDRDEINDNTITGTVSGGADSAFGPQHQPGGNFLDCIDLLTYPPIGAKLVNNTCDGTKGYPVAPGSPQLRSGANAPRPGTGSAVQTRQGAQLTSNQYGYGLITIPFPKNTTFAQLTSLSADYYVTQGSCSGGSPRYQFDLQGGVSFSVYLGTPPWGGCPAGPNTEGELIGGTTPQWFVNGGNTPLTYAQVKALYGATRLLDVQITVDGGWANGGTQQVVVKNLNVNGAFFFPA